MKTVKVDGTKVRLLIENKGMALNEMNEKLGMSNGYLSKSLSRNVISFNIAQLLCYKLDCDMDDIKLNYDNANEHVVARNVDDKVVADLIDTVKGLQETVNALEATVNKIGNALMQQLEYMKDIKDILQ